LEGSEICHIVGHGVIIGWLVGVTVAPQVHGERVNRIRAHDFRLEADAYALPELEECGADLRGPLRCRLTSFSRAERVAR
jgi:hypothetical protein